MKKILEKYEGNRRKRRMEFNNRWNMEERNREEGKVLRAKGSLVLASENRKRWTYGVACNP